MRKSQVGKHYSFKFPKRKSQIQGIVIDYNDEWTLIKRTYDYSTDGFTAFKNDKVEATHGEYEKFAAKILKVKNYSPSKEPKIPIVSLEGLLSYIDKKYHLIQLNTNDGEAFDVVKYLRFENNLYHFDELTTRAKWRYKLDLQAKQIKYISFGSDYLNSLKLVTKFKSQ
jgi:outer membrane protein assembly factor BamB